MSHEFTLWFVGAWFAIALFLGQAVATCLFGAGLVGVYLWAGPRVLHGLVGQDIFFTASTYSLSIVPLYLLMAQALLKGNVIVVVYAIPYPCWGIDPPPRIFRRTEKYLKNQRIYRIMGIAWVP